MAIDDGRHRSGIEPAKRRKVHKHQISRSINAGKEQENADKHPKMLDIGIFPVIKLILGSFCARSREKTLETETPPEHSDPSSPLKRFSFLLSLPFVPRSSRFKHPL